MPSRSRPPSPNAGMRQPGFTPCGSSIHRFRSSGVLGITPRGERLPAHQMSQVGGIIPDRGVPRTRWQFTHDCDRKAALPSTRRRLFDRRLLLILGPSTRSRGLRVDDHSEEHVGVLRAAIFGALADEEPFFLRLEPHRIHPARDQVGLAGQTRNPEAVADVGGLQGQVDRPIVPVLARGDMQFVGGGEAEGLALITSRSDIPTTTDGRSP